MIETIIVEDSYSNQESLKGLLKLYCPDVKLEGIASNVEEALELIQLYSPQLVLLDVELGEKNAFDLLNTIKNINFNIIFISAFEHYSLRAIKYSAIDYILKPIDPEQLTNAIEKTKIAKQLDVLNKQVEILLQHFTSFEKMALPSSKGLIFTKVANIIHCKSDGSYTRIYLQEEPYEILISRNLGELEKLLPGEIFFRAHKSHLINKYFLKEYQTSDGGFVILDNNINIPIARNRKNEFLEFIKVK